MNISFLLPHKFKKIGWIFFIPATLLGIASLLFNIEPSLLEISLFAIIDGPIFSNNSFFNFTHTNAYDELLSMAIIISGILVAFSRVEDEDEFISRIRLESLVWATYVNYGIILFSILFLYNFAFFYAMVVNLFTILICFIARFHWKLNAINKRYRYEEQS